MKKIENFLRSLKNLQDVYKYEPPYDNVILTGLVSLYGICFEQSWKAMKEVLESQGFAESKIGSPKQILKTAYQANLIADESLWLEALLSHNNIAYAYNQKIALDILQKTKDRYVQMFLDLKREIEKMISEQ